MKYALPAGIMVLGAGFAFGRRTRNTFSEKEAKLRLALEAASIYWWEINFQTGELIQDEHFFSHLGYSKQQIPITLNEFTGFIHPEDIKTARMHLHSHIKKESPSFQTEFRVKTATGDWVWMSSEGEVTEWGKNGKAVSMTGIRSDISKKKKTEMELLRLATTDNLTGVLNRHQIYLVGKTSLIEAKQKKSVCSVLLLDIDFFKNINDSMGHATGDEAIRTMAGICRCIIRENDFLGRVGGEEFVIILPDTSIDEAVLIAEDIRHLTESVPVIHDQKSYHMTVSIGAAESSAQDIFFEDTIKKADQALYYAKKSGRNKVERA